MPKQSALIPNAPMARIISKAGAERVADDAAQELAHVALAFAHKISLRAVELSKHSGRKTIHKEDVVLAAKP